MQVVKAQIQNLQIFRGVAALAVVAHHAAVRTAAFVGAMPDLVVTLFGLGFLGVDFFFVLSGFIIMHAHMNDERSPTTVKHYGLKRLTRIYPAYLPMGIGLLVLYAAMPGLSAGGRDYSLASSLLLVPANDAPALSVAWTLVHELLFYGVFLLFFVSWRALAAGLVAWAITILVANFWFTPSGWLRYPLSLLNIEFMFGVGAAWVVRAQALRSNGRWFLVSGVAISLVALWLMMQVMSGYMRLLFAIGLALLIVGFTLREHLRPVQWPRFMLLMGGASYSIYLIHNPLLSLTQRVAGKIGLAWPAAMAFGILLSLLAGWLYYLFVERTALQFFQQRLKKQ